MTKNELMEILEKAKTEGQQMISLNVPEEKGCAAAISVEFNSYRGKDYYDVSFEANTKDGEPIDIDFRMLIGEKLLMNEIMPEVSDGPLEEFINDLTHAFYKEAEKMEEVPAE